MGAGDLPVGGNPALDAFIASVSSGLGGGGSKGPQPSANLGSIQQDAQGQWWGFDQGSQTWVKIPGGPALDPKAVKDPTANQFVGTRAKWYEDAPGGGGIYQDPVSGLWMYHDAVFPSLAAIDASIKNDQPAATGPTHIISIGGKSYYSNPDGTIGQEVTDPSTGRPFDNAPTKYMGGTTVVDNYGGGGGSSSGGGSYLGGGGFLGGGGSSGGGASLAGASHPLQLIKQADGTYAYFNPDTGAVTSTGVQGPADATSSQDAFNAAQAALNRAQQVELARQSQQSQADLQQKSLDASAQQNAAQLAYQQQRDAAAQAQQQKQDQFNAATEYAKLISSVDVNALPAFEQAGGGNIMNALHSGANMLTTAANTPAAMALQQARESGATGPVSNPYIPQSAPTNGAPGGFARGGRIPPAKHKPQIPPQMLAAMLSQQRPAMGGAPPMGQPQMPPQMSRQPSPLQTQPFASGGHIPAFDAGGQIGSQPTGDNGNSIWGGNPPLGQQPAATTPTTGGATPATNPNLLFAGTPSDQLPGHDWQGYLNSIGYQQPDGPQLAQGSFNPATGQAGANPYSGWDYQSLRNFQDQLKGTPEEQQLKGTQVAQALSMASPWPGAHPLSPWGTHSSFQPVSAAMAPDTGGAVAGSFWGGGANPGWNGNGGAADPNPSRGGQAASQGWDAATPATHSNAATSPYQRYMESAPLGAGLQNKKVNGQYTPIYEATHNAVGGGQVIAGTAGQDKVGNQLQSPGDKAAFLGHILNGNPIGLPNMGDVEDPLQPFAYNTPQVNPKPTKVKSGIPTAQGQNASSVTEAGVAGNEGDPLSPAEMTNFDPIYDYVDSAGIPRHRPGVPARPLHVYAHAQGGNISGVGTVGERGKELVIAPQGATVINQQQAKAMGNPYYSWLMGSAGAHDTGGAIDPMIPPPTAQQPGPTGNSVSPTPGQPPLTTQPITAQPTDPKGPPANSGYLGGSTPATPPVWSPGQTLGGSPGQSNPSQPGISNQPPLTTMPLPGGATNNPTTGTGDFGSYLNQVNQFRQAATDPGLNPYDVSFWGKTPYEQQLQAQAAQTKYGVPADLYTQQAQQYQLQGENRRPRYSYLSWDY